MARLGPHFWPPQIPPKNFMWVPFLRSFPGNDSHKLFSGGPKGGVLDGGQKAYVDKVYTLRPWLQCAICQKGWWATTVGLNACRRAHPCFCRGLRLLSRSYISVQMVDKTEGMWGICWPAWERESIDMIDCMYMLLMSTGMRAPRAVDAFLHTAPK